MSDILCIYYSRTGHTRRAVKEIAEALGAEITAITDDCDRSGWRGYMRCGMDPIRALLKRRGLEMENVAYVVTRSTTQRSEEVYDQMDMYTGQAHRLAVSLRPDSEGYEFWRNDFVQNVRRLLEND